MRANLEYLTLTLNINRARPTVRQAASRRSQQANSPPTNGRRCTLPSTTPLPCATRRWPQQTRERRAASNSPCTTLYCTNVLSHATDRDTHYCCHHHPDQPSVCEYVQVTTTYFHRRLPLAMPRCKRLMLRFPRRNGPGVWTKARLVPSRRLTQEAWLAAPMLGLS